MTRRKLDILFSVVGLGLAILLFALGVILKDQADFANDYVKDQLTEQKINFAPKSALDETEKKVDCLVDNAGKQLVSGKQAECYANEFIGHHLKDINEGKTYSQTSAESRAPGADPALRGKADTLFKGESLRGLLLTSYGFSIFGERAEQAAIVSFIAAALLLFASVAGFIHAAFASKKEKETV